MNRPSMAMHACPCRAPTLLTLCLCAALLLANSLPMRSVHAQDPRPSLTRSPLAAPLRGGVQSDTADSGRAAYRLAQVAVERNDTCPASMDEPAACGNPIDTLVELSPDLQGPASARAAGAGDAALRAAAPAPAAPGGLQARPTYLHFAQTAGARVPSQQTLKISAGGPTPLTAVESISWLTLSQTTGTADTAPFVITVTVDPSGLPAAGSPYTGDIIVTNSNDPTDVQRIPVRLSVSDDFAFATLYSYGKTGNLERRITPDGAVTDYEHDAVGRLTATHYPDGRSVLYTYDQNGNRATLTDQRGTTHFVYDARNRLAAVYYPGLNPIEYGHDHAGNLSSMTYPDGRTISYTYDGDNRLTGVTDGTGTTGFTYDAATGRLAAQTLPNGVITSYAYDADGRLVDVVHRTAGGALLQGFHYTLDGNGLRTAVRQDTPSGSSTTSYTYDALLRLSQVAYPDGRTVAYTYDQLGNRSSMIDSVAGATEYVYDADNRLLRAGEETFTYDARGNMVQRTGPAGTTDYLWDADSRLVRVETGAGVVEFEYDGDGNRVAKTVDGVRTNYINDVSGPVVQVLLTADDQWYVDQEYIYGLDRLGLNDWGSANWRYYLHDSPLRSVRGVTDASGVLIASADYDAFGAPAGPVHAGNQPFAYNGEAYDAETGLIYLRARYYDPGLGRFLSRDELPGAPGSPKTVNPYAYVSNNPVNMLDPSGLFWDYALDIVSLGYDIYQFAKDPSLANAGWLAADLALGIIPFVPSTGAARAAVKAADAANYATDAQWLGRVGNEFVGGAKRFVGWETEVKGVLGSRRPDFLERIFGTIVHESKNVKSLNYHHDIPQIIEMASHADSVVLYTREGTRIPSRLSNALSDMGKELSVIRAFDSSGMPIAGSIKQGRTWLGAVHAGYDYFSGGDLGGVSLNRTAELMLQLDDLSGATYDPDTGQIILYGTQDVALPAMSMDDLAVAVHSVYGGEDPGVSIDPPLLNNHFTVRYVGETPETEFGWIMFESDRVLKILSMGKDNLTGQPVTSSVPGYKSLLQRELEAGTCTPGETSQRFWFQPKEVKLVRSADGISMVFDAVSMEVLTESKFEGGVVGDPEAEAFAAHFTEHFDEFAVEWPVLKDLKRLAKVVAVIKWIRNNHLPMDLGFVDNFEVAFYDTPETTPATTVVGDNGTCQITMTGGVSYEPPNEYLADDPIDPVTDAMAEAATGQRPSEEDFLWTFQPPPQALRAGIAGLAEATQTAVAETFDRSRKDGNLSFAEIDLAHPVAGEFALELGRYYDSFTDLAGGFGPRWHELPYALRFPLDKRTFTFEAGPVLDLYGSLWVADHAAGEEELYVLYGIDGANNALYKRTGAEDQLWALTDGSFVLAKVRDTEVWFTADGKLANIEDRNENVTTYGYDAAGRLSSITDPGGQMITLAWNAANRIASAAAPGGRTATYGYDTAGRLVSVTDSAGHTHTYGYDADGRLASAVDAQGNSLFATTYDDYDRAAYGTIGITADFSRFFSLDLHETATIDPYGNSMEETFDDQYRPLQYVDSLDNTVKVTYAGDFGPATVTDPYGAVSQFVYDAYGNLIVSYDATGARGDMWYDGYHRLVATRDPEMIATAFSYDANHNLTTIYYNVDLVFDEQGNLTGWYYDANNVAIFTYDAAGNLATATDPRSNTTTFTYDAQGRLIAAVPPSGIATSLTYDGRARLDSVSSGGSTMDLGYDLADNLASIATAAGSLSLDHDALGNITTLIDAASHASAYEYDGDGNLIRVTDAAGQVTSYNYDLLGNLTGATLPNGTRNAYEYDELGRLAISYTGLAADAVMAAVTPEWTGAGVSLIWPHDTANVRYEVWTGDAPYFTPGIASVKVADVPPPLPGRAVSFTDAAPAAGGRYYRIVAINLASRPSAPSNEDGCFTFELTSGVPQ